MNSRSLVSVLQDKLDICHRLEKILQEVNGDHNNSAWGLDQMKKINSLFENLMALDGRQEELARFGPDILKNEKSRALIRDLQNAMIKIRNLILAYRIKLKGGQELIALNLKQVVKGTEIKGYKPVMY